MAIFRGRDREKRTTRRAYHASAMTRARDSIFYSHPEQTEAEWEQEAWDDYVYYMQGNQVDPVPREKFLKELRKL